MKRDLSIFRQFAKFDIETSTTEMWYCVIYTRVSTKEQAENNYSLETQLKYCKEYAAKKGLIVLEYFGGTYESAKSDERKECQRMLTFVKKSKQKVHRIIVYDYTRFSRSGANAIYIAKGLKEKDIYVDSVKQPTDTTTVSGQFMQGVNFLVAEMENETRRQRMMDGTRQALLNGKWPHSPPVGYTVIREDGKREIIINKTGKLIRKAFLWKAEEGCENTEIIKWLKALGFQVYKQRLTKIFNNPFYCGLMVHRSLGGEVVPGTHPALISEEVFLKVNGILKAKRNKGLHSKEWPETPLRRFMICECCGKFLTSYKRATKTKKLATRKERAKYTYARPYHYYKCPTPGCRVNVRAETLHEAFMEVLHALTVEEKFSKVAKAVLTESFQTMNIEKASG